MNNFLDDLATGLMVITLTLASASMFVILAFGPA